MLRIPTALTLATFLACGVPCMRAQSALPSAGAQESTQPASEPAASVRGITISTHTSGSEWGTDVMPPTMADIASTGANWVATHPYAWIRNDGTVKFREFDPQSAPPAHIARPIRDAQAAGMQILIKPHLGYWGSKFSWRGDIDFADRTERTRFFETYRDWIVRVAVAAEHADAFAVGTELDKLLDEDEWRQIIAAVRAVTDAKLTYAANWTDYDRVGFWDALDAVGIQAYFPIADKPTRDADTLRTGWRKRMAELREFATRESRDIVFTELGYNRAHATAVEPWASHMDGSDALLTQATCLRVALEAIEAEPRVVGSFLWKWFPGQPSNRDHNFKLQQSTIRATVEEVWGEQTR